MDLLSICCSPFAGNIPTLGTALKCFGFDIRNLNLTSDVSKFLNVRLPVQSSNCVPAENT